MASEPRKILIVDDDLQLSRMLMRILQKYGYAVETASNGQEGLVKARAIKPALVIMDVMMPVMSGYEACRQFKADPVIARTAVLILTARGHSSGPEGMASFSEPYGDEQTLAMQAGADAFMSKPVMVKELINQVEALISGNGSQS